MHFKELINQNLMKYLTIGGQQPAWSAPPNYMQAQHSPTAGGQLPGHGQPPGVQQPGVGGGQVQPGVGGNQNQAPQTQSATLSSPLYPWMRSQFGKFL